MDYLTDRGFQYFLFIQAFNDKYTEITVDPKDSRMSPGLPRRFTNTLIRVVVQAREVKRLIMMLTT